MDGTLRQDGGAQPDPAKTAAPAAGFVFPRISFVVPVRNDAGGLRRCLAALRNVTYPQDRLEIIVADNGSTDGSAQTAREMGARVVELPGLTVSGLRNRAAREASGDVLAFVDADHEIEPGWLQAAVAALEDPTVGAAGASYSSPPRATWVQRIYDSLRDHRPGRRDVAWLGSGNLAMPRSRFEEVGGFDESITTCEDVDLCARLRRQGYRILSDSRLRSVHHGDPPTLGDVFRRELWRGQDNLRVTLRNRLSLRDVPSLLMPAFHLVSLIAFAVGAATAPLGGLPWAAAGLGGAAAVTGARAWRLVANGGHRGPLELCRVAAVAVVYETARALALVLRVRHRGAGSDVPAG